MMDGWGMSGWGWAWMSLVMIVGLLVLGLLVLTLIRGLDKRAPSDDRGDPSRILAQRLARGEIDEEDYQRRRNTLRSS